MGDAVLLARLGSGDDDLQPPRLAVELSAGSGILPRARVVGNDDAATVDFELPTKCDILTLFVCKILQLNFSLCDLALQSDGSIWSAL